MSTLSEDKSNEIPTETEIELEETKEQIDSILQQFDLLTSSFDRFMFRYISIYLISLLFLGELLMVPFISSQSKTGLLVLGESALPILVLILLTWPFRAWRLSTPKTLRDLLEKKRIYLPNGKVNTSYLHFLEDYHNALSSHKRYFFSIFLMIIFSGLCVYGIVRVLSLVPQNILVTTLYLVGCLLFVFSYLGGLYCFGIAAWVIHISGQSIRKLAQTFEFRIQPFHTDRCGGLKVLGDFCFGLVSPLLIGSGLLIGCIFIYFIGGYVNTSISESGLDPVSLDIARVLYVGVPLLLFLVYSFPAIVLAFILPLWDIHTKLVSQSEADEDAYNAHMEVLLEQMQSLLDNDKVEEAKHLQEKKAILETLHTPYPIWPFSIRSKIFSTVLGTSGSFLIGIVTAALPVILTRLLNP